MKVFGLALVLCAALRAPSVLAADTILVAVVRPRHADTIVEEAAVRLAGELSEAGCSVRFIEGKPGADGRALVEGGAPGAGTDGLFATIAILVTARGAVADVWVADHLTRKTLVRRVDLGDPGVTNAASDLAVRTAELLRASLLEVSGKQKRDLPAVLARWIEQPDSSPAPSPPLPEPEPAPEPPPAPPERALPARRPGPPSAAPKSPAPKAAPAPRVTAESDTHLEVGVALLANGFGIVPEPLVQVDYRLPARLFVRATLLPGFAATTVNDPAGSVALRPTVGTIALVFAPRPDAARFQPVLTLGAGLYHLKVDGSAKAPYRGEHRDFAAAVLSMGGGLGVRITAQLASVVALDVLVLSTDPALHIVGAEVGHAGNVAYVPSLGLQLSL